MTEDITDFVFIFFHVQKCTSWQVTGRSGTHWHPPRTVFTCIKYSAPKLKCHFHLKLLYHEVSAENKEAKTKNCTRYNICTVEMKDLWLTAGSQSLTWARASPRNIPEGRTTGPLLWFLLAGNFWLEVDRGSSTERFPISRSSFSQVILSDLLLPFTANCTIYFSKFCWMKFKNLVEFCLWGTFVGSDSS